MTLKQLRYWIHLGITSHSELVTEIAKLDVKRNKFIQEIKDAKTRS